MKVFVSSTYVDLIEYRKAVERAVNLLKQQFVGMEYFGARSEEPKVACLEEIKACDVFVGIYAHRYGFIPNGDTKSITEQEFDYAKKIGKTIFCYRVSAKQPWVPEFIEEGDAKKKLNDFLAHVGSQLIRQEFSTPDDLLAKVSTDLARHLSETHHISISLIPHPPLPYFFHPYPLQANFTGRKPERAMLSDWLTRGERQTAPVFVVEALGGMGKSALAWYWLHNDILPRSTDHWSLAGLFWWSFYDERDFGSFLRRALEYASGGATNAQANLSDRERLDALVTILRQKRFLFILDGFERVLRAYARMDAAYRGDEFDADAHDDYRACADPNIGVFLKAVACGGCLGKLLITSRLYPRELDDLEGAAHWQLTGMDATDAVAFFQAQNIHGTRAEIEPVCADYGFHPLSLRLLAGALVKDPRYHADIRNAPRVNPLAQDKERKILDLAYDSLPPREQKLLGQLSAFRNPLKWETISAIFRQDFQHEGDLARCVGNLAERGLYMRDSASDTFDLHPVIRRYCYDHLSNRAATHARFVVYFVKIETPQKIQSLADLQATIELYHHTVRAGRYDEACRLYIDRIGNTLLYQFGAYQMIAELLRALFPDGEDKPPRLKDESDQAWTLNSLANSYSFAGQPRRAVTVFEQAVALWDKASDKKNLAVGLENVTDDQLKIGEMEAAERNLQRSIEICREIKEEFYEAIGHRELGHVLAYRGEFVEAERELDAAFQMFGKEKRVQSQSVVSAHRVIRAILMGNPSAALDTAHKARELAEEWERTVRRNERDFIVAEWMIGAALVAGMTTPTPTLPRLRQGREKRTGEGARASSPPAKRGELEGGAEAERHLAEALARDRKIGLVKLEAAILLEFAKLRKIVASSQSSVDRQNQLMQESFDFAHEALAIAERCEYRLQLAEIHNFLAEWWLEKAVGSKQKAEGREQSAVAEAIAKAKERAKERAWCDGPPYHYKVAYERAEQLLKTIDQETR